MAPSASVPRASDTDPLDLAIVGAGPVGLFAAYYAGFRGLRCALIDALPFVGGQIAVFYPESFIYDSPGFPRVRGDRLVAELAAQAFQFAVERILAVRVVGLDHDGGTLTVRGRSEHDSSAPEVRVVARAALLTVGIGAFAPQKIPDPAIARWEGQGLDYHVDDPTRLGGRRVLVVGGTQRGVELALAASRAGAETTLIHRRDRLAVPEELRAELEKSSVDFRPFRELEKLHTWGLVRSAVSAPRLERAVLVDRRDDSHEEVVVDTVLPCFGFSAARDDMARLGANLEGDAIAVDSRMATSLPSTWAAGDGAAYPGKVRILAAGFGEACTAINNITATIFPGASLFPGYSSHREGAARRPSATGRATSGGSDPKENR